MTVYLDLVVLLNFLVDGSLLLAANRLTGYPNRWKRVAIAAGVGGIYAGACMIPGFAFLGNLLWRMVCLAGMSVLAFGRSAGALRRGMIFVLLSMALGGMALGLGKGGFLPLVLAAIGVAVLCKVGLRTPVGAQKFLPVELCWKGETIRLVALMDTGNTLRDPLSGEAVMVLGAQIGYRLGLTKEQLQDPVGTVEQGIMSGLRLIPYRAVGQSGGMLLGLRMDQVKLNGKNVSPLVAFAPDGIGGEEGYQALAGGTF